MTLNLLRTGAGVESIKHMERYMSSDIMLHKGQKAKAIATRYRPTRYQEILQTEGSLFWIIKGSICIRQKIIDFVLHEEGGESFCHIVLDPEMVRTESYPHKAIQGWRYLKEEKAPKDMSRQSVSGDILPHALQKELRFLGLL